MSRWRFSLFAAVVLAGCTRTSPVISERWSRSSAAGQEPPHAYTQYQKELMSAASVQLPRGQRLHRITQKVAGASIEGTWVQAIHDGEGQVEAVSLGLVNDWPEEWNEKVLDLRERQDSLIKRWAKSEGQRWGKWPTEIEVVIAERRGQHFPALRIRILQENEARLREFLLGDNGRVLDSRTVALPEIDGRATVFPGPPNQSALAEEILPALIGDGTLTGSWIKALSADGKEIVNPSNEFRYTPDRQEFDSVQAYFFADEQARWFSNTLAVKLPRRVEVKLHVGAPVPGNAMFYYGGQVRLGDGDGKTYRGIPRDPSIVKHEVSHAYVEALSGLGFEDDPGIYSEAFADLFAALADDRPAMGEYAYIAGKYRRTMDQDLRADRDLGKGKYESSLVVSGTFWDLSRLIGLEPTARLAVSFLARLGSGGQLKDFTSVYTDAVRAELSPEQQAQAMSVFKKRGWENFK